MVDIINVDVYRGDKLYRGYVTLLQAISGLTHFSRSTFADEITVSINLGERLPLAEAIDVLEQLK